jgi:hypothetical protein
VRFLALTLVDLLLAGVRHLLQLVLSGKAAVLRLWVDAGARDLLSEGLDFLLGGLRSLEKYLGRVRTRTRYRVFFYQFTVRLAERYRSLRRG